MSNKAFLIVRAEVADTGISKWTLTGTTPEGLQLEVRGCDFYTFRDGMVVRKDSYWKIIQ
jgi:ketosteroid isomerase-like protein